MMKVGLTVYILYLSKENILCILLAGAYRERYEIPNYVDCSSEQSQNVFTKDTNIGLLYSDGFVEVDQRLLQFLKHTNKLTLIS